LSAQRNGVGWFVLALLISPLLAGIFVAILRPIGAVTASPAESLSVLVDALTPEAKQRVVEARFQREQRAMQAEAARVSAYRAQQPSVAKFMIAIVLGGAIIMLGAMMAKADDRQQTRFYSPGGSSLGTTVPQGQGSVRYLRQPWQLARHLDHHWQYHDLLRTRRQRDGPYGRTSAVIVLRGATMKHTDIFAELGVPLTNPRWSWGGMDRSGKVYLNLWSDGFEGGQYVFKRPRVRAQHGLNELIDLVRHAVEHNDGRIGVVISRAENPQAMPRSVASARKGPDMRIIEFNETGPIIFKSVWA
jgi:hypothetical protein